MNNPISIALPYPISANRYWRSYRGRVMVSPEARAYKTQLAFLLAAAGVREPIQGRVAVAVALHPPEPKDALKGLCFTDDDQVWDICATRSFPCLKGGVYVNVSQFNAEAT